MEILITGGTGYLGKYIVKDLSTQVDFIYLLIQKKYLKRAQKDFLSLGNVIPVAGDIKSPQIFDSREDENKLRNKIDVIIHGAGCSEYNADYFTCFFKNVVGTQNVLQFAKNLPQLKFIHYISTLAVNGDYKGKLTEEELNHGQKFNNHFAKSKFDAELILREFDLGLVKKRIYRLGALVGDDFEGELPKSRGPYPFFEKLVNLRPKKFLLETLKYLPMPIEKKSIIPLIPVRDASKIISTYILNPQKRDKVKCFHVYSEDCPTLGEFIQEAFEKFGLPVNIVPTQNPISSNPIMEKIGLPKEFITNLFPIRPTQGGKAKTVFPGGHKSAYNKYKIEFIDSVKRKFFSP
ncbi:MAG: hypothetical protein DRQ88_03950 [Epsilonproteobacteria bacterium]|nr:MAG: hypothetical protein DRQ89_04255 [Campylobacterota bacterium]RLA67189.1 MAG: hypothetical protein DRQ88_03950 [Campylobacterota bacterium]